jgi:hypothetical protein
MRYCQLGHENEMPAEFLARKQRHCHKLIPIYPGTLAAELQYEVADLWLHTPSSWAAHIDITLCDTSAEFIKLAADKDKQLQASSLNNLAKLVRSEMQ